MVDFKQIIGRGTRVREDYGKLFFTILDYTGSATRMFADPEFDGEPALITEEEMDKDGNSLERKYEEPHEKETQKGAGFSVSETPKLANDSEEFQESIM